LIAPGTYALAVENSRKQREEYLQKKEAVKTNRLQEDIERGFPVTSERRELTGLEFDVDEDTPLMGRMGVMWRYLDMLRN